MSVRTLKLTCKPPSTHLPIRFIVNSVLKMNLFLRTGKYVGQKVPGASLAVMMIEGIVPKSLRSWFGVVKTAVIDRNDNCDEDYACSLVEEESDETG